MNVLSQNEKSKQHACVNGNWNVTYTSLREYESCTNILTRNVLVNVLHDWLIIKIISSRINIVLVCRKKKFFWKEKEKNIFTIVIRPAKIKWVRWEAVKKSGVRKIAQHYLSVRLCIFFSCCKYIVALSQCTFVRVWV